MTNPPRRKAVSTPTGPTPDTTPHTQLALNQGPHPTNLVDCPHTTKTPKAAPMLEYTVQAHRIDSHGSVATAKQASITLDTDMAGRTDAFNPAELFLASIAACMLKGIERVTPMLNFALQGVEIRLHATRQDAPSKIITIDYEIIVDTNEEDRRLELLHTNIRKYGTISNTVAAAIPPEGHIRRHTPN